ncbi:MAG TPA: choice-of-anchor Q domain-containing protein [Edaphocola sp.]|nr:choice-of-anchor Q domain-containing protein [Edaphocola sp.]
MKNQVQTKPNLLTGIMSKLFLLFLLLFSTLSSFAQITPDAFGIVYVKDTATGLANGNSWANATSDLQGAINATGAQKVFVKIGTYPVGSSSFVMKNNVAIYGGFDPAAGIDSLSDQRYVLDWVPGKASVLDGLNSKPVIWNYSSGLTATAILDGFTITKGRNPSGNGGGIMNLNVSPTFNNLIIKNNLTYYSGNGGAMYNENSSPTVSNSYIFNNQAADLCGGVYNTLSSSPTFTNVVFYGNASNGSGTAFYSTSGTVTFNNVTVGRNANYWTYAGIKITGGVVHFNNANIWGYGVESYPFGYTINNSIIQGVSDTTNGNVSAIGLTDGDIFLDPNNNDYRLRPLSPAVDSGLNSLYPGLSVTTKDLSGADRVQGGSIDIGAFEAVQLNTDANDIIYVKDAATGTGSGNSWANATDKLQAAIDVYGTHQVWVNSGVYYAQNRSFILRNNATILGGFDVDSGIVDTSDVRIMLNPDDNRGSILDGMNARPVIWNNDNGLNGSAILDGFTIRNGYATNGGGVYNENVSPLLRNLVYKNNIATSGGGALYNENTYANVTKSIFKNNTAGYGGAIYHRAAKGNYADLVITDNTAIQGGGIYHFGNQPTYSNMIIKNNSANVGGGFYIRQVFDFYLNNILITGNSAADSLSSAIYTVNARPIFTNTTIADNAANAVKLSNFSVQFNNSIVFGGVDGADTLRYSLVEGSSDTTNGNIYGVGISKNDIFKNPALGDFSLKPIISNVAFDAGKDSLFTGLDSTTLDLAGNLRRIDSVIDLGAYEIQHAITPNDSGVVFVKDTATGLGSGYDWANATSNLQGAINATNVQKVFVAVGNYPVPSPNSFVLKNNVAVYGGFDPDNGIDSLNDKRILPNEDLSEGSILNGKAERPVIWNYNNGTTATTILDGFTIKNGYNNANAAGILNYMVSPTYKNLVIKDNHNSSGAGGIFNNFASPQFTNIIIKDNSTATVGAGIVNVNASPSLTNVLIAGNTATTNSGAVFQGGGTAQFTNVTIARNIPDAVTISSGGIDLKNSIVYGGVTGTYTAQYSIVEGSSSSSNGNINSTGIVDANIFINPSMGNFQLKPTSLVVNSGNDALFPGLNSSSKDLAGNNRKLGTHIDMGAYEFGIFPNANGIVYVKDTATGVGNGKDWANATSDLQGAINATDVQKVFVAVGNYPVPSPNSFVMKNGVALYGGFDPDNGIDSLDDTRIMMDTSGVNGSILNGKNERPVIWNEFTAATAMDTTTVLDGFTITGGLNTGTGLYDGGAGIRNKYASPQIRNVVFRANNAYNGAGVFNQFSSSKYINTAFINNVATHAGGGMLNYSSSTVNMDKALFVGNQADNGGAISNRYTGNQTFKNLTIFRNKASTASGGLENISSTSTVINSLIAENEKTINASVTGHPLTLINVTVAGNYSVGGEVGLYSVTGLIVLKNSIVFGATNGLSNVDRYHSLTEGYTDTTNGNIDATGITKAMVFNDWGLSDYTLKSTAPVINKGDNSLFPNLNGSTIDLAGNPRLFQNIIDMGTYESQFNIPAPINLVTFTAKKQGDKSYLQWTTASEQNNKGFNIERSDNSKDWETIGFQKSLAENGNSTYLLSYQFVDAQPLIGTNFYRLKQMDIDGAYEYSPVRLLVFESEKDIKVYPNPANEQITIDGLQGDETLLFIDELGRTVKIIHCENEVETVSVADFISGTYSILIQSKSGSRYSLKLIIRK